VLEKEADCGAHASGRNSGVLHAGFYYTADSLKARFTREGNRELTAFCESRGLGIRKCGKLVVARDERELPGLDELLRRGRVNGVEVHTVTAAEAREIEPRALTTERALWSPTTAVVDPRQVVDAMRRELEAAGVRVMTGTRFEAPAGDRVRTSAGDVVAGYVVNAAGLQADRVAHAYGFGDRYRILPFKGLYLYANQGAPAFRTHIYPVPNLDNPFLGVHFTLTVAGRVKIGPTAIPAFWREHYGGVRGFRLREFVEVTTRELGLLARNDFRFRTLALAEVRKYRRSTIVRQAAELATQVDPRDYRTWGPPGIRAQLLDIVDRKLEMDFRFEGDDRSFHVLNAVSPAFTCAIPFARHAVERIEQLVGG
jgi:L-2-hydroxyglutarate oxidase LhgO